MKLSYLLKFAALHVLRADGLNGNSRRMRNKKNLFYISEKFAKSGLKLPRKTMNNIRKISLDQ
jgi:hypothetical protein